MQGMGDFLNEMAVMMTQTKPTVSTILSVPCLGLQLGWKLG